MDSATLVQRIKDFLDGQPVDGEIIHAAGSIDGIRENESSLILVADNMEFKLTLVGKPMVKDIPLITEGDDDFDYYIGDIGINSDLWMEHDINFEIIHREDRIDNLRMWIGEARNRPADLEMMEEELEDLKADNSEYVIAYYGTNGVITPSGSPKEFKDACNTIIAEQSHYFG